MLQGKYTASNPNKLVMIYVHYEFTSGIKSYMKAWVICEPTIVGQRHILFLPLFVQTMAFLV